jgi:hypothetical protein
MYRPISLLAIALALTGCTTSITYRTDYLPASPVPADARIAGRILVHTTQSDDERIESEGATSFTGSGSKLVAPVGLITRETAVRVFGAAATEGAVHSNGLSNLDEYDVIVRPETQEFSYGFPQLKNLGFAITPEVQVKLRVTLLDDAGQTALEKTYDSGVVEGSSYMISGKPHERVSQILHQVLYDLMLKAAADIRAYQSTPSPSLQTES